MCPSHELSNAYYQISPPLPGLMENSSSVFRADSLQTFYTLVATRKRVVFFSADTAKQSVASHRWRLLVYSPTILMISFPKSKFHSTGIHTLRTYTVITNISRTSVLMTFVPFSKATSIAVLSFVRLSIFATLYCFAFVVYQIESPFTTDTCIYF